MLGLKPKHVVKPIIGAEVQKNGSVKSSPIIGAPRLLLTDPIKAPRKPKQVVVENDKKNDRSGGVLNTKLKKEPAKLALTTVHQTATGEMGKHREEEVIKMAMPIGARWH